MKDISEEIHSVSSNADYLERITHITSDIHKMIRKRDNGKVIKEYH